MRNSILLFSLTCLAATAAHAQTVRVVLSHDNGGKTHVNAYTLGKGDVENDKTRGNSLGPWSATPGSQVCVKVENAHPYLYNYSLGFNVDSTKEKTPDLAPLAALLKAAIGSSGNPGPVGSGFIDDFYARFKPLSDSIQVAQEAIKRSDDPAFGMKGAKAAVASAFRNPPKKDEIDKWENAPSNARNTPQEKLVFAALKAYAVSLFQKMESIQKSYGPSAAEVVERCQKLGEYKTSFALKIKASGDSAQRDVGDSVVTFTIEPRYRRARIEAYPVLYAAHASDVATFRLENGLVRQGSEYQRAFRPGAVAAINLPGSREVAYGPVIGLGMPSDKKLSLSDFFSGLVVSYKDYLRVGAAYGSSEVVTGVKAPAVVDQALPANIKLDDVLARGQKGAWFLFVALPGLGLKSPF
jgi:hypothetical protein